MERLRNARESLTETKSVDKLAEKYAQASSDKVSDALYSLSGKGDWKSMEASNKRLVLEKRALQIMQPALGVPAPSLQGENILRPEGAQQRQALIGYRNATHPRSKIQLSNQPTQDYWMALHILLKQERYSQEVVSMLELERLRVPIENQETQTDKNKSDAITNDQESRDELQNNDSPEESKSQPSPELSPTSFEKNEIVEHQDFFELARTFIIGSEGFRSSPYRDVDGRAIGYGFRTIDGRTVKKSDRMSKAQADDQFKNQIETYQNWRRYITVPLSVPQQVALTSFEYNLGGGIWGKSGGSILDGINRGDLASAIRSLKNHNKVKVEVKTGRFGKKKKKLQVHSGLTKRRNEEAELLLQTDSHYHLAA